MAGIPIGLSGLREESPENLVLDAGAAFKNINMAMLRVGGSDAFANAIDPANTWINYFGLTMTPGTLGATRDGAESNPQKKMRQVKADGMRGPIAGFDRIDEIKPVVKVTLLEWADPETLMAGLGSADMTPRGSEYNEFTPRLVVNDEDYIGNIAIAATKKKSSQPVLVVVEYCIAQNAAQIKTKDMDEVAVQIEFEGRYLPTAPYDVPFHQFVPVSGS